MEYLLLFIFILVTLSVTPVAIYCLICKVAASHTKTGSLESLENDLARGAKVQQDSEFRAKSKYQAELTAKAIKSDDGHVSPVDEFTTWNRNC